MADCECIQGCPFFNGRMAITMSAIVESMKKKYCQGSNADCARHMIARTLGKEHVPTDLIPNQVDRAKGILAQNGAAVK